MMTRHDFQTAVRRASTLATLVAVLGVGSIARAQPALAPMTASGTPAGQDRVWTSTLWGDLATWDSSSGWQVRVQGNVVGGVGAITYPGTVHREQAFYVREGRVRSLVLSNGAASSEFVLPGYGSASFEGSAVAATRYGQIGIVVGAFTTTGVFCAWTGSTFGFTTAPVCASGADRYSALAATTMFDSVQSGSFVTFFYRSNSGGLVRRMRRSTSTGDGAWGSTVMATGVSRPIALLPDAGGAILAFTRGGRVHVERTGPRSPDVRFASVLPPTTGTVNNSSIALAIGYGEGPAFGGGTRCTTQLSVTTSAGHQSVAAFGSAPSTCPYAPRPTSSSTWSAIVPMPSGVTWGGNTLVLRGPWFGQATRTIGVGLSSMGGWWILPYALLEVEGRNVVSHGSP